jgi:xanthine dehydrogenase accessory factor
MRDWEELEYLLTQHPAVLVRVVRAEGSVPREEGVWMAVTQNTLLGTIGGGHLEFEAIRHARQMLAQQALPSPGVQRYPLGPSLGQCCGGVVHLQFDRIDKADLATLRAQLMPAPAMHVVLFGGGHVGSAIVKLLGLLPMQVRWIDSRDGIFPSALPANVTSEHSDPVQRAVRDLAPGSHVLVMSFSHAEDLDIVASCLLRNREMSDLPFIGLIGSKTKWATFRRRLRERGFADDELDQVTSPIGVAGVIGKEPEVIAVAAAAQLLQWRGRT